MFKDKKGEKFVMRKKLNKPIAVPNQLISMAVQQMLLDVGASWCQHGPWLNDKPVKGYKEKTYIRVDEGGSMSYGSIGCTAKLDDVISVSELAEILSKPIAPPHTLMTEEEFEKRCLGMDKEGALTLSIEKWKRCIKEENWDALTEGNDDDDFECVYLGRETCALCKWFGKDGCGDCPLQDCSNGSDYAQAFEGVCEGDMEELTFHGGRLIEKMKDALEELKRPSPCCKDMKIILENGVFEYRRDDKKPTMLLAKTTYIAHFCPWCGAKQEKKGGGKK